MCVSEGSVVPAATTDFKPTEEFSPISIGKRTK
jgi:hypothetical protein